MTTLTFCPACGSRLPVHDCHPIVGCRSARYVIDQEIRYLQTLLGVPADGLIGPITRAAIHARSHTPKPGEVHE